MKLLLDTHVFIWALTDPGRLSVAARLAVTDIENEVFVSAVSFWEIAIKVRSGRLAPVGTPDSTPVDAARRMGFSPIELTAHEAAEHERLRENTHLDPFDRMLIWQAIDREMTLVSSDREFEKFRTDGLNLLWK